MRPFLLLIAALLPLRLLAARGPQERPAPKVMSKAPANGTLSSYAYAPAVFEKLRHIWTFNANGTGRREFHGRVRIQQESAVPQLGQLAWGYGAANETFELLYFRVIKPDGSTTLLAPDAIQDLSAGANFGAPTFTDFRFKHVTVPALAVGVALEFGYAVNVVTPHIQGQFWGQHQFLRQGVCLSETLEIRTPRDMPVRFKEKMGFDGAASSEGEFSVRRWTHSHIEPQPPSRPEELKKHFKALVRNLAKQLEKPDIQFSTFKEWNQVGDWYSALERLRRTRTTEIDAKVAELTQHTTTPMEKVQALYGFVAQEFRYVSLSFGQGRFQPHEASEVLSNRYGDCKDKAVLLATMLGCVGLPADMSLCSGSRKVDVDLPSPAQFDHVILRVPIADEVLWLDPTSQSSPLRSLPPSVRGESVLVVQPFGSSRLEIVPEDPPYPTIHNHYAEATVDAAGTMKTKTRSTIRSDAEIRIRGMLRSLPRENWNETIDRELGVPGRILEAQVSDLADLAKPVEILASFEEKGVLATDKGGSLELKPPMPRMETPELDDDAAPDDPIQLVPIRIQEHHLKLNLPGSIKFQAPLPVSLTRDYGSYRSTYQTDGKTLEIRRVLTLTKSKLPADRKTDLSSFKRGIDSDLGQMVRCQAEQKSPMLGSPQSSQPSGEDSEELATAGFNALEKGDFTTAIELLERALKRNPGQETAWNNLGRAYMRSGQLPKAEQAFRTAIEKNPFDEWAHNNLGMLLFEYGQLPEAEAAFRKQIDITPLDIYAHGNLGKLLLHRRQYAEAVTELELARRIQPENATAGLRLGEAYLKLGRKDEAKRVLDAISAERPNPMIWNNIAYLLCENHGDLAMASKLAQSSVSTLAAQLATGELATRPAEQSSLTISLAASLDTAGWVHHRLGNEAEAMRFVQASWNLSGSAEVGAHLGALFEGEGRKPNAIEIYSRILLDHRERPSLDAEDPVPAIRMRLELLAGGKNKADAAIERERNRSADRKTVKIPATLRKDATAFVFIAFGPEGRVHEVHFQAGDAVLRSVTESVKKAKFQPMFPEGIQVSRVVRVAMLTSSKSSGEVHLAFIDPPTVRMN